MKQKPLAVSGMADFTVAITQEAQTQKDDALALAKAVTIVTTAEQQQDAIAVASIMKSLVKGVEATRVEVKKPALEAGRLIDDIAKRYSDELEKEVKRVEGLAATYQAEQNRIATAARQAEIDRQNRQREAEEAERQKAEQDALQRQQEADKARLADLERIQAAKDGAAREEAQRLADIAAEERARRASQQQAHERELQEARLEEERKRAAQLASIVPQKATGASVRVQIDYEVTDIHALYAARPDLVSIEPKRSMILASINIPNQPPIAGLRTFETTKLAAKA